jgi:hypothetical protein
VVIKNRQRITASSFLQREIPLEVHLPETIRRFMREPFPGFALRRFFGVKSSMPPEDLRDCTGRWYMGKPTFLKNFSDLTSTPGRMLIPNSQYHLLELIDRSSRTVMRALRTIFQSIHTLLKTPGYPFISRLGAKTKSTAQLSYIGTLTKSKCYKLIPQRHSGTLLPGHGSPPHNEFRRTFYTPNVLPMSPNMCYLSPPSVHPLKGEVFGIDSRLRGNDIGEAGMTRERKGLETKIEEYECVQNK